MRYALIAVDVQFDFLPGGSLQVIDGDQILVAISGLIADASVFIVSRDWHPDNHFSFSDEPSYEDGSWPPHCIQKTRGAKIHPSINRYADFVISKGMSRNPPDTYSAFAGKTLRPVRNLQEILDDYELDCVVVTGLVLEKCVKFTALDANALGYRTIVPLNCTRPVGDPTQSITTLHRAGVEVVESFTND